MKEKFPYLNLLSRIAKVFAWLCLSAGLLIFFIILAFGANVKVLGKEIKPYPWGLFSSIYYLSYGVFGFIVFSGVSEFLQLLISIEENTRRKM
jgi:heme/copper-type cytochrome/quinol oxidase subunit 3